MPHSSRPELKKGNVAHVTIKLRAGLPSLRSAKPLDVVRAAIGRVNGKGLVRVVEYSIQSNHVHMLIEASNSADLSRGMASLNTGLGMRLNRLWDRTGRGSVFRERFHLVVTSTPSQMRRALNYVLQNSVHHGIKLKTLDPCSSSPSFGGWKQFQGSNAVARAASGCVSAQPQTWLLRAGWQKVGGQKRLLSIYQRPSVDMTHTSPALLA